jgi:hypothetical protein
METYVVRIWRSSLADAPRDEVRGLVERVGDGAERPFVGIEQLIERLTQETTMASTQDGRP